MGTTGGDPGKISEEFSKGSNIAVIAPNMAKQIVALQATLLQMSQRFPKSYEGYELTVHLQQYMSENIRSIVTTSFSPHQLMIQVQESHQSTKADTSGTAKVKDICSMFSDQPVGGSPTLYRLWWRTYRS